MFDLNTIITLNEAEATKHEAASAPARNQTPRSYLVGTDELPGVLDRDFQHFSVIIGRDLTPTETALVAGTIGYALSSLAAEDLSNPDVTHYGQETQLDFFWDSTKSHRDDPDFLGGFQKAERYIQEGSPVRKTNRQGPNTKGTRLVTGIGSVAVQFLLPVDEAELLELQLEKALAEARLRKQLFN